MILKLISPIFLGLLMFLTFALDHVWRDKRTKKYKVLRDIFMFSLVITVIVNIVVIFDSENIIKNLNDKVATLENQNKMLSILERMNSYIITDYDALNKKYPKGYFLFASNKYTVIPSNKEAELNFTLDWKSSKVKFLDDSFIYIVLGHFYYHPNEIEIKNLNIVLERKVGSIADGLFFNKVGLFVELLDDRTDELIYVIGFKGVESVPKWREPKPQVEDFVKKFGIGSLVSAIDTNVKKYITINSLTISSGWETIED